MPEENNLGQLTSVGVADNFGLTYSKPMTELGTGTPASGLFRQSWKWFGSVFNFKNMKLSILVHFHSAYFRRSAGVPEVGFLRHEYGFDRL